MAVTNTNLAGALALSAAGALLCLAAEDAAAPAPAAAASSAGCQPAAVEPPPEPAAELDDPEQRALAGYLSRRYQIAIAPTEHVVETAYRAAHEVGLDPLLVLAVISVESRFNPIAESVMGAKGLMQIIPKYHKGKLDLHGGEDAVLDPESNIRVGAQILQEYVDRTGNLQAGLQVYNGAARDESSRYAQKVMAERERLEAAVRSAVMARAVTAALAAPVKQ
jgi:soluble lytic murein transglycosylase-like protein